MVCGVRYDVGILFIFLRKKKVGSRRAGWYHVDMENRKNAGLLFKTNLTGQCIKVTPRNYTVVRTLSPPGTFLNLPFLK